MIVDSSADDIVYSSLFTGVDGNYLKPSIARAGMDPDNLPSADASSMDFSQDREKPKSWKEIWGSGQGIGAIKTHMTTQELVDQLATQYGNAKNRLFGQANG